MTKPVAIVGADPKSNYVQKLMDKINNTPFSWKPGVRMTTIKHDSWCKIFRGKACNCDPEIELG